MSDAPEGIWEFNCECLQSTNECCGIRTTDFALNVEYIYCIVYIYIYVNTGHIYCYIYVEKYKWFEF